MESPELIEHNRPSDVILSVIFLLCLHNLKRVLFDNSCGGAGSGAGAWRRRLVIVFIGIIFILSDICVLSPPCSWAYGISLESIVA